jgi:acyl-CoA thioesterase-1
MEWVIYLFGSGLVFFLGVGLLVLAAAAFTFLACGWSRILATVITLTGLVLIALSATPLPLWFYLLGAGGTFAWLFAERSKKPWFQTHRREFRLLALALWAVGVAMEAPYHLTPRLSLNDHRDLYILGDSVSAGADDRETWTWPRLLSQSGEIKVHDFSRMGATVSSALKQAQRLPDKGGIVLLEIGGNDLLGSTRSENFERALAKLLDHVAAPERVVLMFELPLPPFCNDYGRIQRRLAAEHDVVLIPKRIFAEVLTAEGATLDSVHLSKRGHERMAEVIWSLIRPTSRSQ